MHSRKLLIAIRPEDYRIAADVLGDEFELAFCCSLSSAQALLDDGPDLIACSLHFDDGRLFDFLRYAKAHPRAAKVPFFCVTGTGGRLPPAMLKSVKAAAAMLGAEGFINFAKWQREMGEQDAREKLRDAARRYAAGEPASFLPPLN